MEIIPVITILWSLCYFANSLTCNQGYKGRLLSSNVSISDIKEVICQEGQICAVGDFNITVNGNDAKAKMGGCVPYTEDHCSGPAGCTYIEAQAKETFPFFTVKQQCHMHCCQNNNCNHLTLGNPATTTATLLNSTSRSSTSLTPMKDSLTCNHGFQGRLLSSDRSLSDIKKVMCEEAEICAVGNFDITIYNMDAKAKMGGCIPHTEAHCSGPTGCLYIEAEAKKSFPIFTVKQPCHMHCCQKDSCNNLTLGTLTTATATPLISTPFTTAKGAQLSCNHGSMATLKLFKAVNTQRKMCRDMEVCATSKMNIKFGDESGQMKAGTCLSKKFCSDKNLGCSYMKETFAQGSILEGQCKIQCCDKDICNSVSLSDSPSISSTHQIIIFASFFHFLKLLFKS